MELRLFSAQRNEFNVKYSYVYDAIELDMLHIFSNISTAAKAAAAAIITAMATTIQ